MYHIYLDESYNLTPGAENPIFVFGGFGTTSAKTVAKTYKRIRKITLNPRQMRLEIKSFDKIATTKLIPRVLAAVDTLDLVIYIIKQDKKFIPLKYFNGSKLNYEKLYIDILTKLLTDEWDITRHDTVSVTIDAFKTKTSKQEIIHSINQVFRTKHPEKRIGIHFVNSVQDLNLQIADFIVGSFFRNFASGSHTTPPGFEKMRMRIIINIL